MVNILYNLPSPTENTVMRKKSGTGGPYSRSAITEAVPALCRQREALERQDSGDGDPGARSAAGLRGKGVEMGITLNVWVFSGIIGVAYIMGYLMSRTMGRMLAVEGADAETPARQESWLGTAPKDRIGADAEERIPSGRMFQGSARAWPENGIRSGRRLQGETATCQESGSRPGRRLQGETAACQESGIRPGRRLQDETGTRQASGNRSGDPAQLEPDMEWGRTAQTQEDGEMYQEEQGTWSPQDRNPGNTLRQGGLGRGRAYWPRRTAQGPDRGDYAGEAREWQKARIQRRYRGRSHREQQAKPAGHPIASPVAGQVDVLETQGRRGVLLTPEDNKVYAPASGKIIRLYPRGNEFLLRTDSGVVLRLQAGERDAEMTRDYFRPRIMQNEFVGKGKLLLEYDREALARDGYDTHVSMTVEEGEGSYDLSVTGSMWVKNGQDCLWVL